LVRREVLGGRAGQPGPPLEPSHVPSHMTGIGHLIAPRGILGEDFLGERLAAHIGLGGDARGDGRSLDAIGARMTTGVQQHRALWLLADAPHGRTVADMLAYGFTDALLDRLARDGLATIQPGTVCASTRRITVIWVAITEAGQRALANKRLVE
jgi:hypothetical protein